MGPAQRESRLRRGPCVHRPLHCWPARSAPLAALRHPPPGSRPQAGDAPFVLRTSPASDAALGFSLGYFATDLLLLALHYPALGGAEMALHHAAALVSVAAAALQGEAHAYTLALLATECTTPFVNARFLLEKGGWRHHPLYALNGLLLLLRCGGGGARRPAAVAGGAPRSRAAAAARCHESAPQRRPACTPTAAAAPNRRRPAAGWRRGCSCLASSSATWQRICTSFPWCAPELAGIWLFFGGGWPQ